jgi:RNA polymerase sigma-70 factor, ECF subfamily
VSAPAAGALNEDRDVVRSKPRACATRSPSALDPEEWGAINVLATMRNITARDESWSDLAILVRRAQAGDREAFGELVEQFQRTVHAICLRRLGNPSEALEMTQEVFLHVLRRLDQLREPERFAGWLRQVTVRMAINRATRRNAPPSVETAVLEGAGEHHEDPLDELIARERARRLWEALERLKTIDREVLVAFYIQGRSLIEIAEQLDVPIGTVKRRLHTARKRLKVELETSSADADEWGEGLLEDDGDDDGDAELIGACADELPLW